MTLKGLRKLEETKREIESIEKGQPLKVGYIYSLKKTRSKSDYAPYEYKIQDESHTFSMNGDLPYGYFSGNVDYLFRKDQTGLDDDINYYDAKLENDYFAFSCILPLHCYHRVRFFKINTVPASIWGQVDFT